MNTKEMIADLVRDFLESYPHSRVIRWVMVLLLLFNDIPQKTVASITNYTDRQVKYKLEVSVKTIERELEEYDLSDPYKLVRKKEKRTVHVNYAGGWLLAPFIVDIVKKTRQAYDGVPRSVEAEISEIDHGCGWV